MNYILDQIDEIYSVIKYTPDEHARQLTFRKFTSLLDDICESIDELEDKPTYWKFNHLSKNVYKLKSLLYDLKCPYYIIEVKPEINNIFDYHNQHPQQPVEPLEKD